MKSGRPFRSRIFSGPHPFGLFFTRFCSLFLFVTHAAAALDGFYRDERRIEPCRLDNAERDEFVGHSFGALGNAYTDLSEEYLLKEAEKLAAWAISLKNVPQK